MVVGAVSADYCKASLSILSTSFPCLTNLLASDDNQEEKLRFVQQILPDSPIPSAELERSMA